MRKKFIYIIDDDETILSSLRILLESEGYNVKTSLSGVTLREEIRGKLPDLILIDYLLPDKNGDQIVSELKQSPSTSKIPVIMIAATSSYKTLAYAAGVDKFINKPFDIYYLLKNIDTFLQN